MHLTKTVFLLLSLPIAFANPGVCAQDESANSLDAIMAGLRVALQSGSSDALYELAAQDFRNVVGAKAFAKIFEDLDAPSQAPWSLETDPPGWPEMGFQHRIVARSSGQELIFRVSLNSEGKYVGLVLNVAPPQKSLSELGAELSEWEGQWGVAGVHFDSAGQPLFRWVQDRAEENAPHPLGSIFKVYVLAEVARRIAEDQLNWDTELAIQDKLKSLPSGTMQNEEAGKTFPLEVYVSKMIGISDNTATDHLLHLIGRESVEQRLSEWKNSVPERNQPFLSTLEMFLLKGTPQAAERFDGDLNQLADFWKQGSREQRMDVLDTLREDFGEDGIEEARGMAAGGYGIRSFSAPKHAQIEWFAGAGDIVRLFVDMARRKGAEDPVAEAFLKGLSYGNRIYHYPGPVYHGFKGGSETGIFCLSLLLMTEDGSGAAVCVLREGFPPFDQKTPANAVEFTTALARLLLEKRYLEE